MKNKLLVVTLALLITSCVTTDKVFHGAMKVSDTTSEAPFPVNVILYPITLVSVGVMLPIAIGGLAIEVYR